MTNINGLIFALALLLFVVSGCATVKPEAFTPQTQHIPDTGYFLVSVTSNSSPSALFYREQNQTEYQWIRSMNAAGTNCDIGCKPEDDAENGRVVAIALPPGDYEINGFAQTEPRNDVWKLGWYRNSKLPPLKFTIVSNQVIYLGGLRSIRMTAPGKLGGKMTIAVLGYIKDLRGRDINIFRTKYPNLQHLPLRANILLDDAWEEHREIYSFK